MGVLLAGPTVPAWVAWILRAILAHPDLTLAIVVYGTASDARPPSLFGFYERLDRRVFGIEPDPLAPVDASETLAIVPSAAPEDAAAHDLDVLLHLTGQRPAGPLLDAARHGVWSYRFGRSADAAAPLFAEHAAGVPDAETALEILDHDGGRVIYRSTGTTDSVSLNRSRVPAYWKGARFALRRLEDLAGGRWEPDAAAPRGATAEPAPPPTATQTLRHVATVTRRAATRKVHAASFQHQWFLGLRRRTSDRLPQDDPTPWRVILPPPDRSYADPFLIHHGGETFLFFELLVHRHDRGELAVARLDRDGGLTDVEPILPVAHHSSYPYVFADGGTIYMIPESGEARRVDLFAATDFPLGWRHVATLLDDVNAVDATVHRDGGRYWMWVSMAVPGGRLSEETFLYFSDRLDGGWTPHPANPVVSDARRARPAGRPFTHRGQLVRPSMNCSGRYGRQLVFNVVERLDPDGYSERPGGSFGPEWAGQWNLAAHTYTFDGDWEATDGMRTFSRLRR